MIVKIFDTRVGDVNLQIPSPTSNVAGVPNVLQVCGLSNMSATTDPGAANDMTQGYVPGSVWFNTTNQRWWDCVSNATGAAVWVFGGAAYANGGTNPPSEVTQFGQGISLMAEEGNIYREVVASRNPGGTAGDYVVGVFSLPANSFDVTGRGINFVAQGNVANNANSKRIKIYYGCTTAVLGSLVTGGTVIADTGAYTTAAAVGWAVEANVFKYGANGSNTQLGMHVLSQVGNQVATLLTSTMLTATENGAILCAITANAATTATDITYNFFEVNAMN